MFNIKKNFIDIQLFAPTLSTIKIIFDSNITQIKQGDTIWTTSGETLNPATGIDGTNYIFDVTLNDGYGLDTITLSSIDSADGVLYSQTDNSFTITAGNGGINQTITLTSKRKETSGIKNVKINNKILSMVSNKYAKTINGVSIQCWKKKENPGPHDNILVAGTYNWVDIINFDTASKFTQNLSFSCPGSSSVYSSIHIYKMPIYMTYAINGKEHNANVENRWVEDNYKTIILSSDQQVDSTFFDWAINQGNLVYQGG